MIHRYLVFYSPLIVLGIGLILFSLFKSDKEKFLSFLGSLVFAATAGFILAAIVIFYITFTKDSPQGPFAPNFIWPNKHVSSRSYFYSLLDFEKNGKQVT